MTAAVFIGPSAPPAHAATVLDATFLPPVRRGDIDALLSAPTPPTHIGIVDGKFLHEPSISPKEILVALDRGVRVYGASSMGALRAVELSPYGMVGIGAIYGLFQSGELDADDEVAITFDPDTLEAFCEPLVNMRLAFTAARERGLLSRAGEQALVTAAKAIYFPQRTYRAVLHSVGDRLSTRERDEVERFLHTTAPDAKREDALAMLARMRHDMDQVTHALDS